MGLMNGDEALHLVSKLQSGEDVVLTPHQYLEMAILLYNLKDKRWPDPIARLLDFLDFYEYFDTDGNTFRDDKCFDRIDEYYKSNPPYATGSYYKTLNDEETLKRMGEKGKTDENSK